MAVCWAQSIGKQVVCVEGQTGNRTEWDQTDTETENGIEVPSVKPVSRHQAEQLPGNIQVMVVEELLSLVLLLKNVKQPSSASTSKSCESRLHFERGNRPLQHLPGLRLGLRLRLRLRLGVLKSKPPDDDSNSGTGARSWVL